MKDICGNCLDQTNILGIGVTMEGRSYTIYYCSSCGTMNRVFDVPQTEHETVLVALVTDALSASEGDLPRE